MHTADPAAAAPPAGIGWMEIGLVIFFAVFVAIVVRLVLSRPGPFRRAARIPLEDGTVVTPRRTTKGPGETEHP